MSTAAVSSSEDTIEPHKPSQVRICVPDLQRTPKRHVVAIFGRPQKRPKLQWVPHGHHTRQFATSFRTS